MSPKHRCQPTLETGEGFSKANPEGSPKILAGMREMIAQQRKFMAMTMARTRVTPNQQPEIVQVALPPPPLDNNQQPIREMWLLKRFKDCIPSIFKSTTDAKEVKDWIREMEKCFKIMKCTSEKKLLLAEFSLKNKAQIW